ncbi:MAG: hypothetical protein K2W96_25915 [Gemmataceae bacterium]|nr:hypothetical protein [Gemmataceae bacterium]
MEKTQTRLVVRTHPTAGSSLEVPRDILDRVKQVLTENGIGHWARHFAYSFDGKPFVVPVFLRHGVDPVKAQEVLDANF